MTPHLVDIVGNLSGARVGVVGDIMLDRFVYGNIERISPEAPVPVMKLDHSKDMLGGAGNVASNVAALRASVALFGVVADDEAGSRVRRLVADIGADAHHLIRREWGPTATKTRMVVQRQQMLRLDDEVVTPLTENEARHLLAAVAQVLPKLDVLLLSDYAKGVLLGDTPARLISLARAAGKIVIVDPKGRDYSRYRGASVVTPNLRELREAADMPCEGEDAIVDASLALLVTYGLEAVVATRSEQGMSVVTAKSHIHLPTSAREVFDVSGAGDTVVATLACALSSGIALADAARLANAAAGVAVGKLGTAQVTIEELAAMVRQQELGETDVKIVLRHEAAAVAQRWRQRGYKVGVTNGCFDLLHPGHIALLRQARAACDRLIVGINTDSSVRRLKGDSRPIQSELARAAVLASLEMVDRVVLFDEDTPIKLIEAIRPDVLVKGADYRVDQVVGGDFVQSYGGRVALADLKEGFSTTRTVQRVLLAT